MFVFCLHVCCYSDASFMHFLLSYLFLHSCPPPSAMTIFLLSLPLFLSWTCVSPLKSWLKRYTCLPLVIQGELWGIWCCQVVLSWCSFKHRDSLLSCCMPGSSGLVPCPEEQVSPKEGNAALKERSGEEKEWETVKNGSAKRCWMVAVPNARKNVAIIHWLVEG